MEVRVVHRWLGRIVVDVWCCFGCVGGGKEVPSRNKADNQLAFFCVGCLDLGKHIRFWYSSKFCRRASELT